MQTESDFTEGRHWFAVQTKPRQEKVAFDNLVRQGFETYLPKICCRKRRRRQWQQVTEPLFPNYLFICVNPNKTSLAPVRSTLGVNKLVRFGQLLKTIPEQVIQFLKAQEDVGTGQLIDKPDSLKKGDKVEILEGPFEGLTALYQLDKAEDRVLLLIDILGRQTTVQLHKDNILSL